ncbi:MAG: stage III sporulation protein AD, partial [Eubacteriales bacterium]|nr:stage III sporulation protein AD [Eubacteriales bacterium]
CKDAGQNALAAKLELAGTAAAVAACMPLFRQVLQLAGELL